MSLLLSIYLGIYVLILIGVSWFISRREKGEDFLIAGRDRKWWSIAASKFAGSVGVGWFIAYTGYAYEYGLGVFWVVVGTAIGYLFFAFWAGPRIYENSQEEKYYTIGDVVYDKLKNPFSRDVSNVVSNLILFIWLLVGIIGGAKVITYFGLMSYEWAVVATVLVVMVYILLAGFKAVLLTDMIQAFVILLLVGVLSFVIVGDVSVMDVLQLSSNSIDIGTSVGFLILGILAVFSYSNFYQLVFACKDSNSVKKGIGFSIVPIGVVVVFLLIIGMFMYMQNPNLDSGVVFIEALNNYLPLSLLPIGVVVFFAGLMSSADTNIYAITSHYVLRGKNTENPVKSIRISTIILSITAMVIAFVFRDIIDVTILAAGCSIILSVGMIYIIGGGRNKYRFYGSVFMAMIGVIIGIVVFGLEPTMILPVLMFSIIGLLYNGWFLKKNDQVVEIE